MEIHDVVKEIKQSFRQMMDGSVAQSMRDKGVDYHLNWGATIPRLRQMADELRMKLENQSAEIPADNTMAAANSTLYTLNSKLYALSIALWKENVRECKILATMLMPPDEILPEVVDIWMEQTETLEVAEQAAMNLYCRLPYAPQKAFQWIASDKPLYQLCGFHVLSRLFMNGQEPNERGINEFLDQALAALQQQAAPAGTMAPTPAGTIAPTPAGTMAPTPAGTIASTPAGTIAPTPAGTIAPTPGVSTPGTSPGPSPSTSLILAVRKAAMNSISHFADLGLVYERLADSALRNYTRGR